MFPKAGLIGKSMDVKKDYFEKAKVSHLVFNAQREKLGIELKEEKELLIELNDITCEEQDNTMVSIGQLDLQITMLQKQYQR